jgi:NAD(P)-dependent dehydrogenase (short-subunit alcohol dehydrogenase family)
MIGRWRQQQNRGVGLGIVNLISNQPTAYTVYITSRSGSDLPNPSCKSTFLPRKLDISDPASVESLAAEVKKAHPDGIDAIINNAGVNLNPDGYSQETIKNTLKINYYGTQAVSCGSTKSWQVQMCDNFIPLVKKGGRIVNVASVGGHLNGYSADAKKRITDAASSTSALKDLVSEYEVRNARNESTCCWSAVSCGEETGSRRRF